MSFIVLPPDQISYMNGIMDYILKNPAKSVGFIKKKFNLTEEEYQMIYDLTMPHVRIRNITRYWKDAYTHLRIQFEEKIKKLKATKKINAQIFDELMGTLDDCEPGSLNKTAKIEIGENSEE